MNVVRVRQIERQAMPQSAGLRVPGWKSRGAAPLPDDHWEELRVGLGYCGLLYSHTSYAAHAQELCISS